MNRHECFEVTTTEDRVYLVEGVNAAHAAYNIEEKFQERVISVIRKDYDRILLTTGDPNATQTANQGTDNQGTAESTGGEKKLALVTEESAASS